MSTAARAGSLLGAAATASVMAVVGGGPPAWVTAGLCAASLVLAAAVLFGPSETPARRLGRLIQVWRSPGVVGEAEPDRAASAPASLGEEGG
ncbi:hypothetical protein ACFZCP_07465 [Streptomyces sp. NPDC007971]|uniref:hypothetical protein n=1 Tax=Streptomyces sp. NPDC007971 TaxID=3364799 RepID=UPI0036E3CAFD